MKKLSSAFVLLLSFVLAFASCVPFGPQNTSSDGYASSINDVPSFAGEPFVVIGDNKPDFEEKELTATNLEYYSELDLLGRCGTATACISKNLMPTEERGNIGQVKPSGWQTVKYDSVDGKYLYNRCHLIGFQLAGENANEKNLITGTRYMNVEGMLPFENMVADYVKETNNHVLYRVTPVYDGMNLVARGVQMEAISIEDDGEGICFNVYVYNNQPGIKINYATGESSLEAVSETSSLSGTNYVINTNTKKFHLPECSSVKDMKKENRKDFAGTREQLLTDGYSACKSCKS